MSGRFNDDKALPMEERVRRARGKSRAIATLLLEWSGDKIDFFRLVARHSPKIDPTLLVMILEEIDREGFKELLQNPARTEETNEWIRSWGGSRLRRNAEVVARMKLLAEAGGIPEDCAFMEEMTLMATAEVPRDYREAQGAREMVERAALIILQNPSLSTERLHFIFDNGARFISDRVKILFATHPEIGEQRRRRVVLSYAGILTTAALAAFVKVPEIRRDPETRDKLVRSAVQHANHQYLIPLIGDGESDWQFLLDVLAEIAPERVGECLALLELRVPNIWSPEMVESLLSSSVAAIRLSVIAAMGRRNSMMRVESVYTEREATEQPRAPLER